MATGAQKQVVVVGAGIIGLQVALNLLKAGFGVTIVSKFWPGDESIEYTSPWAGAVWRSNLKLDEALKQKWNMATYRHWQEEHEKYPPSESGLDKIDTLLYWDKPTPESEDPHKNIWFSDIVEDFQTIPTDKLPQEQGIVAGVTYRTFCVCPPKFVKHRLQLCKELGAKTVTKDLISLEEVFSPDISAEAIGVVNCSGMGALKLVPDDKMFPTKGQTIIVKGKAKHIGLRMGGIWENFMVPQPGTDETLLSGCKMEDDWSTNTDDKIDQWIMDRCKPLAPELLDEKGHFEVLRHQVGRRPTRHGGARIELEWSYTVQGKKKFVCHSYGHGHTGYENSVGSAIDVLNLIFEAQTTVI